MPHVPNPGSCIFVIGAGFSRPAGLPVATELYSLVRQQIVSRHGSETKFQRDVSKYLRYCVDCGFTGQTEESLDLERFISYLDIEHYLGFRGSDTWSAEGNEAQLMIRKAIGDVIHSRTPLQDKLPDEYYRFAEGLSVHDTVLTLNYDLVLERALSEVGKPFRRFPNRFESVNAHGGTVESKSEEVVLLKLHGSIDWFDDRQYLESKASLERQGLKSSNLHSVFQSPQIYGVTKLVDGQLPDGDALRHIHYLTHVDRYYRIDGGFNAPYLLSPSHVKFVYAEPLLSFWRGIGRSGGYNLGVSVIGFSLPKHDEYIRIALYQILSNYGSWWDTKFFDSQLKDFARFVDFRNTPELEAEYKSTYRFVNADKSRFFFDGFGSAAVNFLFRQRRGA